MHPVIRSRSDEKGALVVMTAIVLIVLTIFVAFVVDAGRMFVAHSEKTHTADFVALAGLQRYLTASDVFDVSTHATRLSEAKTRAQAVASSNYSTFEWAPQAGSNEIDDPQSQSLRAGRWWAVKPEVCNLPNTQCPCNLSTTINVLDLNQSRGCFQPCEANGCLVPWAADPNTAPRVLANAVQVEIKSPPAGLRQRFFGTGNGPSIKSRATAAVRPNRGVMLFDLGRMTAAESHSLFYRNPAGAREPAFELNPAMSPNCGAGHANPCTAAGNCVVLESAYSTGNTYATLYQSVINSGMANQYGCFNVTLDGDSRRFLVDITNPAQPFGALLQTLSAAMTSFNQNATALDSLAVIGFEDVIYPELELPSPGAFARFRSAGYSDFAAKVENLTANAINGPEAGFFPRPVQGSNVAQAISRARDILKNDPFYVSSSNYITVISNGLFSCTSSGCNNNSNTYAAQQQALSELLDSAGVLDLRDEEINLNIVFAGKTLRPHTSVVKKRQELRCMTPNEKRYGNYWDAFETQDERNIEATEFLKIGDSAQPTATYLLPLRQLSTAVNFLSGRWMAVRESCRVYDAAFNCNGENFLCLNALDDPPAAPLANPSLTPNHTVHNTPWAGLDSSGRLLCDPYCETPAEQAQRMFPDVFRNNAIALVQ